MGAGVRFFCRRALLCLAGAVAFSAHASAASESQPLLLNSSQPVSDVKPALTLLYDPQGTLTLEQAASSADFSPLPHDAGSMNFGYRAEVLWLKLPVQSLNSALTRWILEFRFAYLDDVRVFVVRGSRTDVMKAGLSFPVSEWEMPARKPVFPMEFSAGEKATVYIRVQSEAPLALDMRFVTERAFHQSENCVLAMLAVYFGMLGALGCYNLLLYLAMRQREFLLYSAFVFVFGISASHMNGVAQLVIVPALRHSHYMVPTGFALAATLAVLFARRFLWLRDKMPLWHRALGIISVLWGIGTVSTLLVAPRQALEIMSVMAVLTTVSLLSAGIAAMKHKVPAAGIFVFAWTLLLIGTAMLSIRNTGLLPSNVFTVFGMQFGSATEMLLLSFALASSFNDMKEQKEKAQQALVHALIQHEHQLEKRVAQRTEQLEETKARLQQMVREDILTGLPNRLGLAAHFDELRLGEEADKRSVAVMLIDLDGFKPVNDGHGHEAGDELLKNIAERLLKCVGDHGVVGRLGGDEFVVLLNHCSSEESVIEHARELLAEISATTICRLDNEVGVNASIGICFSPVMASTLKMLIARADDAMYQVKRSGKCGVTVYQEDACTLREA